MKAAIISDAHDNTTSLTDFYLGQRPEKDKGFVVLDLNTLDHSRIVIPNE